MAQADNVDYVQQTALIYAVDAVGNRTATPLTFNAWVDNVAPVLTVTDHVLTMALGQSTAIISGTVSDGSPTVNVVLQIQAPDGERSVQAAARDGVRWWYDLTAQIAGTYTVWVAAADAAGNVTTAGPYTVAATCTNAILTAGLVSAEPSATSPMSVTLTAAITNTGTATLPAGLPVAFSSGVDPIGSVLTTQPIAPNGAVTVTLNWPVENPGDHDIVVSPNAGPAGARMSLCALTAGAVQTITVLDLPLDDMWNLISFAVNPFHKEITTVTRPLGDKFLAVLSYDQGALSYYPKLPSEFSTLKTMDAKHGYWIRTTLPAPIPAWQEADPVATLRVSGTRLAEDRPLPLAAGWNLVSYLPQVSQPVTEALHSIDGKYQAVLSFNHGALSFYPALPPDENTLQIMQPGMGYWIRTTEAVTLTYPASGAVTTAAVAGRGDHPAAVGGDARGLLPAGTTRRADPPGRTGGRRAAFGHLGGLHRRGIG